MIRDTTQPTRLTFATTADIYQLHPDISMLDLRDQLATTQRFLGALLEVMCTTHAVRDADDKAIMTVQELLFSLSNETRDLVAEIERRQKGGAA